MIWDGKLIKKTDINSGLLTVPIEITNNLKKAAKYYGGVISEYEGYIELGPTDQWVIKKYGEELPIGWMITYKPRNLSYLR